MADYPSSITDPRVVVNLPGETYDVSKTTRFYAEDLNNANAEIVAIETTLGTEPQGVYASVKAWLTALAARVDATWGHINGTLSDQTDLQTALNGKQASLGFTAENVANKSTSVATDQASNTKYPSVKAVYDWVNSIMAATYTVGPTAVGPGAATLDIGTISVNQMWLVTGFDNTAGQNGYAAAIIFCEAGGTARITNFVSVNISIALSGTTMRVSSASDNRTLYGQAIRLR